MSLCSCNPSHPRWIQYHFLPFNYRLIHFWPNDNRPQQYRTRANLFGVDVATSRRHASLRYRGRRVLSFLMLTARWRQIIAIVFNSDYLLLVFRWPFSLHHVVLFSYFLFLICKQEMLLISSSQFSEEIRHFQTRSNCRHTYIVFSGDHILYCKNWFMLCHRAACIQSVLKHTMFLKKYVQSVCIYGFQCKVDHFSFQVKTVWTPLTKANLTHSYHIMSLMSN